MLQPLRPQQLRREFTDNVMSCASTAELEPTDSIIGQERAVRALRFGLGIDSVGFNVYVAGPAGIGKMTAVRTFLEQLARERPVPPDLCYVHNFDQPYEPRALELPTGFARRLQHDMKALLELVREELPKAFESDDYVARRDEMVGRLNKQREKLMKEVNDEVTRAGFALQMTPVGLVMLPIKDGQPMSDEAFEALGEAEQRVITGQRDILQVKVKDAMKAVRSLERLARAQMKELDRAVAGYLVSNLTDDLDDSYAAPEVAQYVRAVHKDILDNIDRFRAAEATEAEATPESPRPGNPNVFFRRYEVNVLVDNLGKVGAPVIIELNPSYTTLFGRIEKEPEFGTLQTDFTLIKPGSIHRARGGFLILPVEDLLRAPLSWDALKRTLRAGTIEIEDIAERLGAISIKSLKPQPVPARVKVILVGRPLYHYLLHANDDEFAPLFKVKADFDTQMPCSEENIGDFVHFVCNLCRRESLRHLDATGVAALLECAVRLADDQAKLSTEFGSIADLVREASYWASQSASEFVSRADVERAVEEQIYRSGLVQDRYRELIADGTFLIATAGAVVGQVNGLSVVMMGNVRFGRPARITATVGPGRRGVLDIEREVKLGGPTHSKGVLILGGFLAQRFGATRPLSLDARLAFEQSYDGVDGDSASSTELYAILSALAEAPIRQGVAVTGSVNQRGEVQAIGGVNEKIEGFFDVCTVKGLTGEQGVMIPETNTRNLVLRRDVVEAVAAGRFHVWPVDHVDRGIEHLTGIAAGERDADGNFAEGTIGARIEARLTQLTESLRNRRDDPADPTATTSE